MISKQNNLALAEEQTQAPQDLMSIRELSLKHHYDYNFLYKRSIIKGDITPHFRGVWKLSERETLEFCRNLAEQKLKRIRKKNGGEWYGWSK